MNLGVAVLATAVGLLFGSTLPAAQSCPCSTFNLATLVKEADVIFVGKALTATTDSTGPTDNSGGAWTGGVEFQTRLAFDVQTVIKGELPRFVEVTSPIGPCGFMFSVGERYLVVGLTGGAAVATDSCKGNVSGPEAIEARIAMIHDLLRP